MRQTQKASCLIGDIAEAYKTATLANDVEQIAMFGRGGIGPVPGSAGTRLRSAKPDEHRSAGRVANVTHQPLAALPPSVGQVMAAYRPRRPPDTVSQLASRARHHTP